MYVWILFFMNKDHHHAWSLFLHISLSGWSWMKFFFHQKIMLIIVQCKCVCMCVWPIKMMIIIMMMMAIFWPHSFLSISIFIYDLLHFFFSMFVSIRRRRHHRRHTHTTWNYNQYLCVWMKIYQSLCFSWFHSIFFNICLYIQKKMNKKIFSPSIWIIFGQDVWKPMAINMIVIIIWFRYLITQNKIKTKKLFISYSIAIYLSLNSDSSQQHLWNSWIMVKFQTVVGPKKKWKWKLLLSFMNKKNGWQ